MALNKGKVFLIEGRHGDEKIVEGYLQTVDQIGVVLNSQSDGRGLLTIYPAHNVYKVELRPPPLAGPGIVMPGNVSPIRR